MGLARVYRRAAAAAVVGVLTATTVPPAAHAATAWTTHVACRPSTAPRNQPTNGSTLPPPAPRYFARDFPTVLDSRLRAPVGGLGGIRRHGRLTHTPVVFIHGNQADAQNWLSPMLAFQRLAGYSLQEMYAISYNGLGNYAAGAPTDPPTAPDRDYIEQNPTVLATDGHGAANDDEVPDLCRFIAAVQAYTGSRQIDIVAHSLGVTIARRLLVEYPALRSDVVAFVAIAGANHGTTICRGLATSYYGCNEIAPGSAWLAALNRAGEARGPTRWMTVYDGGAGDPYFDPPYEESSPRLAGAVNRAYPGAYHNDLRVRPAEVDDYLAFLLVHGQDGPGADRHAGALARRLIAAHPDGRSGTLCGVPRLTGC